jgi:hypothetical protein
VTFDSPRENNEPEEGTHELEIFPKTPWLSVVTKLHTTFETLDCESSVTLGSDGHITCGGSSSLITTVNAQKALLPELSSAVQFTKVLPISNSSPLGTVHDTSLTRSLSTADIGYVTTAEGCRNDVLRLTVDAQLLQTGSSSSTTVIENLHVSVLELKS